jgi:peptidoglycan/xylan/chitin deacetylase (PgdA/CDA1 family)
MERELVLDFLTYLTEELNVRHSITPMEFYQKSKDPKVFKSSDVEVWLNDYLEYKGIEPKNIFNDMYLDKNDMKQHPLVDFGNHTENHFMMSSLDKEKQFQEIENAQIYLRNLGISLSKSFAIPFGNQGSYNNHTLAAASELGYKTILLAQADRVSGLVNRDRLYEAKETLIGKRFLAGETSLF